jgi:hypothetical protein
MEEALSAEVEKLKDQLARAMKGFTVTKQQLQLKTAEADEGKRSTQEAVSAAAKLREERDSGDAPTDPISLSAVTCTSLEKLSTFTSWVPSPPS